MGVAALEVALTAHMVNMNIPILVANAHIVAHLHSVAVHIAPLENISMSLATVNAAIAEPHPMVVVPIVHQESMSIKK